MPSDHQAVCETVYAYATGIDTRDWALYRSIFADEVTIDFTSYNHALDHGNDEAWFSVGGFYRDELVRTPARLAHHRRDTHHSMATRR